MDPILLFLVGLVILFSFLLVITLALWLRSVIGEKNEYEVVAAILKHKLQEVEKNPQGSTIVVNNLINFCLAYYERVRARKQKVEPANTVMRSCWELLPKGFQKRLAPLGSLASLKIPDDAFQ